MQQIQYARADRCRSGQSSLEVEDFRFSGKIYEVRSPIEDHVVEKPSLVNLTSLGAGDSDPNRDFILHEIRKEVIGAVASDGFLVHVPCLVRPRHPSVDEEEVHRVPF